MQLGVQFQIDQAATFFQIPDTLQTQLKLLCLSVCLKQLFTTFHKSTQIIISMKKAYHLKL